VSGDQLAELYRGAFCFVSCSLDEGFGIPIAEAISSGCPSVCLDRPIFREVAGENGIFIENDVDDFLQKFLWLENNWMEQKMKISKDTRRFSWRKTHENTLRVYQQLNENS
jgi:mannosyltransferase